MHTQKFLKLGDMLKIEIIAEMCAVYCKESSKLYCSCLYVGQFLLTLYFFLFKNSRSFGVTPCKTENKNKCSVRKVICKRHPIKL